MLSLEPEDLMKEIRDAEKVRNKHLAMWREILNRYVGGYYRAREGNADGEPTPENYIFEYSAFILPKLVFDNPGVNCQPTRLVTDADTAKALELGINQWIRDSHYKKTLRRLALDSILGFGVSKCGLDERGDYAGAPGYEGVQGDFSFTPMWPYLKRVRPGAFLIDSQADDVSTARFFGEEFDRDLEDLMNDPRYPDKAAIEALTPNAEDKKQEDDPFDGGTGAGRGEASRKRVTLYELYIPEHGKLITLAKNGQDKGAILREDDYYGPRTGPYTLWGMYLVPGQIYPLSPVAATFEQFLELQTHADGMAESAASYKKGVIYDSANSETGKAIANFKPGEVVGAKGFNSNAYAEIEVGGADPIQGAYVETLRARLDRALGFSDAQRGVASGATATESTIAGNNADIRTEYMRQIVSDAATDDLSKVGWYMFNTETIVMDASTVDPVSGQPVQGTFYGGVFPGQEDMDASEFHLEIVAMSMQKVDNALLQKRAQDSVALATQIGPAVLQMPWINWRRIVDQWGEAMNIKNYSKTFFNEQVLAFMSQMNPLGVMGLMDNNQDDPNAKRFERPPRGGAGGGGTAPPMGGMGQSMLPAPSIGGSSLPSMLGAAATAGPAAA